MRRLSACVCACLCWAVTAEGSAQVFSRPLEASIGASYWSLDRGTGTTDGHSRTGVQLGAGVSVSETVALQIRGGIAPEGRPDPGFSYVGLGVRGRLSAGTVHPFLTLGGGFAWMEADRLERMLDECVPEAGCMFEGISYDSGRAPYVAGSLGVSLPVARTLAIEPELTLLHLIGGDAGPRNDGVFLGTGVSIAWRP